MIDLHTHTAYSYDAAPNPLPEHVAAAVEKGVKVLGISEHLDFFYRDTLPESDFAPETVDYLMYKNEVEPFRTGKVIAPDLKKQQAELRQCAQQYAEQITLRTGIEMGQPHTAPELAEQYLKDYTFDYIIGSIHHASDDMDLYFFKYEYLNQDDVMNDYFDEMEKMLDFGRFQILGHIDYPLRVLKLPHNRPSLKGYMERVDVVLKRIIEQGIALESNTKGMFGWQQEVGPEDFVLTRYRELGGELITVGSDSHMPEKIAAGIPHALERLKQYGFAYVTDFEAGKPIQHKL